MFLVSYGSDWVSRYFAERYIDIDPIVSCGRRAHLHLDWSDVVIPKGRRHRLFRYAERHGIGRYGLTIPIRGLGERALFTVNARSSPRDWEVTRKRLRQGDIAGIQAMREVSIALAPREISGKNLRRDEIDERGGHL